MKALVTGAGGQLGRALLATVPREIVVDGLSRAECDISDTDAVGALLAARSPDVLINAAAYTAVDQAESERDEAFAANATAPGFLARSCAAQGCRFIHVSTDFVFDGTRSSPYPPNAETNPLGVYGESKLAGERAVTAAGGDSLIVRTGWLYSHRGNNFLKTMLRLHGERDALSVVADQVGTPTRAESLAEALWAIASNPVLSGIYHWSDAGVCSWYDFAQAIGEEAQNLGLIEQSAAVAPIRSADYPTPAKRPAYSVLDKTQSWEDLYLTPVHWRDALRDTLAALENEEGH
ncbi:MAG: dTDP-4-dehydrorhamnose reductase [Pseudomonadota bacterium]